MGEAAVKERYAGDVRVKELQAQGGGSEALRLTVPSDALGQEEGQCASVRGGDARGR